MCCCRIVGIQAGRYVKDNTFPTINRNGAIRGKKKLKIDSPPTKKTRRWARTQESYWIPLRHNPLSIHVHGPPGPWDLLRSPAESVRKAKVGPEGQAIRDGEKPTDLLGKEVRACRDGGAGVTQKREHFTQ